MSIFRLQIRMAIFLAAFLLVPLLTHADTCVNGQLIDNVGNVTGTCTSPDSDSQTADQAAQATYSARYQFQNEGIFGCNQIAGVNMSVGTMAAIGGIYVPVNDAAVTVNTGTLVYLECILRPLVDRLRESATSATLKKMTSGILTQRNGGPQYSVNRAQEDTSVAAQEAYRVLTDGTLNAVSPAYFTKVRTALARNIQMQMQKPESALTCPIAQRNLTAMTAGPAGGPFSMSDFENLGNPVCNAFGVYNEIQQDVLNPRLSEAVAYNQEQRITGRGFYDVTENADNPLQQKTLTPASVVQESFQQILGSPVRQLESANNIGQMIGALFAGITTQITTDNRGLAGIMRSVAGQPSYLDQVAKESSQGVLGAATNVALSVLNGVRQAEISYLASMNSIAATLTSTIAQLRATEAKCWDLIIPKAQDYAAQNGFTLDQNKIKTATSSMAFSQQIIDSQITPLATQTVANVKASQQALTIIDRLISGVTNTASLDAQRISLQQLDTLVAQKALHTQYDATAAAQRQKDTQQAMSGLVTDTAQAWGDSPDPNIGWCNINNAAIVQQWAERWKK